MRLISRPEVEGRTGMRKTWLYKAIAAGQFPAPRKVGRRSLWPEREIDQWIEEITAAAATPSNKKKKG